MEHKEELIKYRLERCKSAIEEAKISIDMNKLHLAENRIYYAIYYVVSALSLKNDYSTSKHSSLQGWFNKNFVNTGIISKELGKIYSNAFENRQESDYEDMVEFEIDDVKKDYENMLLFVENIENLISK